MITFTEVFEKLGLDVPDFSKPIKCPFHGDDTPSNFIDEDRGIFNCFSCGGGNVVVFFMRYYYEVLGIDYQYQECMRMLGLLPPQEERYFLRKELKRKSDKIREVALPYYYTLSGIERIKAIQGYNNSIFIPLDIFDN